MNKIKLKLSGEDCGIITKLIQETEVKVVHQKITDMVADLLLEVLEKTHGRSLWVDKKNTINLTPAQGRAFNLHFTGMDLSNAPYAQNLLRQIVASIDQQLTNNRKTPVLHSLAKLKN